jgi:hypothetical protein
VYGIWFSVYGKKGGFWYLIETHQKPPFSVSCYASDQFLLRDQPIQYDNPFNDVT